MLGPYSFYDRVCVIGTLLKTKRIENKECVENDMYSSQCGDGTVCDVPGCVGPEQGDLEGESTCGQN